jgi:hypothetical protein
MVSQSHFGIRHQSWMNQRWISDLRSGAGLGGHHPRVAVRCCGSSARSSKLATNTSVL